MITYEFFVDVGKYSVNNALRFTRIREMLNSKSRDGWELFDIKFQYTYLNYPLSSEEVYIYHWRREVQN